MSRISLARWRRTAFWAAATLAVLMTPGSSKGQNLPDGPGRDALQKVCTGCHGVEAAVSARHTREEWEAIVSDMVDKGASGTDAELEQIITYLSTNYRRRPATVNVNTAPAKALELDLGFTKSDAEAIEQYRQSNGKFKSLDDLKKVPKIDTAKIEAEKNRITF